MSSENVIKDRWLWHRGRKCVCNFCQWSTTSLILSSRRISALNSHFIPIRPNFLGTGDVGTIGVKTLKIYILKNVKKRKKATKIKKNVCRRCIKNFDVNYVQPHA